MAEPIRFRATVHNVEVSNGYARVTLVTPLRGDVSRLLLEQTESSWRQEYCILVLPDDQSEAEA